MGKLYLQPTQLTLWARKFPWPLKEQYYILINAKCNVYIVYGPFLTVFTMNYNESQHEINVTYYCGYFRLSAE